MLVRCERDGCVFTPQFKPRWVPNNIGNMDTIDTFDCPRCGRRYRKTENGYESDRPIIILEV